MKGSVFQILFITASILIMVVLVIGSVNSSTGAISYLVKYIGVALAILAFANPRVGAYILLGESFLVDVIKRYSVYHGTVATNTVIEVLVVQMLAVVGLILAVLVGLLSGKAKFKPWVFSFFIIGLICAGIKYFSGDDGFVSNIKEAFNLGAYISLTFIFYHLFKDYNLNLKMFYNMMLGLVLVSSVVAIRQSLTGFTDVEDFYMHTHLSPVASGHYLSELERGFEPRGFGLASGVMNFLSSCGLAVFAFLSVNKRNTFFVNCMYGLAYALIGVALFAVRLKTGFVVVLLCPLVAILIKKPKYIYGAAVMSLITFVTLVLNSVSIRDSISEIDYAFRGTFGLSDSYSIQTFEARLLSYSQMLDSNNWKAFGLDSYFETHDVITFLLLKYGYIPLGIASIIGCIVFVLFVERSRSLLLDDRDHYMKFCGSFGLVFAVNLVGGSNLASNPVNFVIWTSLAAALSYGWGQKSLVVLGAPSDKSAKLSS